jgi:hypothetical protein
MVPVERVVDLLDILELGVLDFDQDKVGTAAKMGADHTVQSLFVVR